MMKFPAGLTVTGRAPSPDYLLSVAVAGVIAGMMTLISCTSFAALLFNGKLAGFVSTGILMTVSSVIISGSVITLMSACRPVVALPDDDIVPVLALLVTLVVSGAGALLPPEALLATVVTALCVATLLTGIVLSLIGMLRLGSMVRYLPYCVMSGYFAGAGVLLVLGSLRAATDLPINGLSSIPDLFTIDMLLRWLPALLVTVVLQMTMSRWNQAIVLPAVFIGLTVLFYLLNSGLGRDAAELMTQNWLLGPFPETELKILHPIIDIDQIDWEVLAANAGSLGTIVVLSALSLMLTAGGLSLIQAENLDINHELSVAGVANIAGGLLGGLVTLPSLTLSRLATEVGAPRSRMVGFVVVVICLITLAFGMPLIAWLPKSIIAGVLMYLGWTFIDRWVVQAYRQLPRLEYCIVIVILLTVVAFGFLEGVFAGLISAIFLSVVNYSRINVIRYILNGSQLKSNVDRDLASETYLTKKGEQTLIFKLQGYLFFGTTAELNSRLYERLDDDSLPPVKYLLLDFEEVSDMDSSATMSFQRLAQEAARRDHFLLFTGMSDVLVNHLLASGFDYETTDHVILLEDLDRGIEWCEQHLLEGFEPEGEVAGILSQLAQHLSHPEDIAILETYLEKRTVEEGEILVKEGEESDEMFLLESCTGSVFIETDRNTIHRIRRAGRGTVFGEVGFYLGVPRTASVIIDTAGDVYVLSGDSRARLELERPQLATELHKFMLRLVTRRLQLTTSTLRAVLA